MNKGMQLWKHVERNTTLKSCHPSGLGQHQSPFGEVGQRISGMLAAFSHLHVSPFLGKRGLGIDWALARASSGAFSWSHSLIASKHSTAQRSKELHFVLLLQAPRLLDVLEEPKGPAPSYSNACKSGSSPPDASAWWLWKAPSRGPLEPTLRGDQKEGLRQPVITIWGKTMQNPCFWPLHN